jgi:hypothetical protein
MITSPAISVMYELPTFISEDIFIIDTVFSSGDSILSITTEDGSHFMPRTDHVILGIIDINVFPGCSAI